MEPRAIRFARRDREGESAAGGGILSGGNYPSRTLLGVIGGAILLLLLLLFALNQIGNDNGDDALTPTSTVESVFDRNNGLEGPDAEAPATPGNGDTTEPGNNAAATEDDVTEPASEETPEATRPDDRPRPGGDNQLDSPDGATETPDASVDDLRAGEPQPHGF